MSKGYLPYIFKVICLAEGYGRKALYPEASWQRSSLRCSPLEPTILPEPISKTFLVTNTGDIFSGPKGWNGVCH
jgi:hypothetical protein